MKDPRLNSDLERRLLYLEKMAERNFQDNGRIQRQIGDLRFEKSHQANITTVAWKGRNSIPKVRVIEVKVPTNEIMRAVRMQDDRQYEFSKRLNRAEQRILELEKEFD